MSELTRQEFLIADCIAEGLNNRQIAAKLGLRLPTVKNHIHSVYVKLGVKNRVQIARAVGKLKASGREGAECDEVERRPESRKKK